MGKYDGIKNPAFTDEEYEEWELRTRVEAILRLTERAGRPQQPGDFLGYFCCPTCHERDIHQRIDMVMPDEGDLVIDCETCGSKWTFPVLHSKTVVLTEGASIG